MEFSEVLGYLISLLITLGIGFLVELLRRWVGLEGLKRITWQLDQKKELALIAVKFAQQAYKQCSGAERYNRAAEWLAARAQERGIGVNGDEVKGLIESTVRQIKDQLGEEWAKLLPEEEPQDEEAG